MFAVFKEGLNIVPGGQLLVIDYLHMERVPTPEKNFSEKSQEQIHKMMDILRDLSKNHPDAEEIVGGEDTYWHLDETPLNGTQKEFEDMTQALELVQAFKAIAENASLAQEDRIQQLKEKYKEFNSLLYGIESE